MSSSVDDPNQDPAHDSALDLAFEAMERGSGAPEEAPPPPEKPGRSSRPSGIFTPVTVGALLLEATPAGQPLQRRTGPRAEEAWLRARLNEARALGDATAERSHAITLARLLATRGTDLDTATSLARRAIALGEDAALRSELSGWLAGLGEPSLAAATLRGLCDPAQPGSTAMTMVRLAVLLARAGDATGAADALREAARMRPKEAIASELLGTLAAWAPTEVAPAVAAAAYLEAAERRAASGDEGAAFEDRLRAFEVAPESEDAAESLASALSSRDRASAADEVRRAHGNALIARDAGRARRVHTARMARAIEDGDPARAVGAMLDAEIEGEIGGDVDGKIGEILTRAGLYELFAARLELRAEGLRGAARSKAYAELATLYAGPLASSERAIEAWIEAAACDANNVAARETLRDHAAATQDHDPLMEALIRIAETPTDDAESRGARLVALRELSTLAEDEVREPSLSYWALSRLAASEPTSTEVDAALQRVTAEAEAEDEALRSAKRAADAAKDPEARTLALRRLAAMYRGRPEQRDAYVGVLAELANAVPSETRFTVALSRVERRTSQAQAYETFLRYRLQTPLTRVELVKTRMALSAIARRAGDEKRAMAEVLPLLSQASGHRGAASAALVLAARLGRTRDRADAVAQLAAPAGPALRAVLLAVAAELYAGVTGINARELARETASEACEIDPSSARATVALATATFGARDRTNAQAIEQAMGVVVPRGRLCDELACALEALGEVELALAWTQRWLALTPGSPRAIAELIRRAAVARDPTRVSDALAWVLAQAEPLGELAQPFAEALHLLFQIDPDKALAVSRRTLDVFGPRVAVLRAKLLQIAEWADEPALGIAVLERWVASKPPEAEARTVLLELSSKRAETGDYDGAARELVRAVEAGAPAREVLSLLDEIEAATAAGESAVLGSDGLVAMAEARAGALARLLPGESQNAALAYRRLGSLRWDLADDRSGAELSIFTAAQILPRGGVELYARDLRELSGVEATLSALLNRAASLEEDDERRLRAAVLIEAANLAVTLDRHAVALDVAREAVGLDPSRADAIAVAERCAGVDGGIEALDGMYDRLADAALGCYGQRAAHYRGARKLEQLGAIAPAFRHAIACFEAVPSEGTSYVLLARLAERAQDPSEAARALERVAATGDADARAAWLKRAATLAGQGEDGARMRFDMLLRAMNVRPDPSIVADVARAMSDVIAIAGDVALAALRFGNAVKAALPRLEGPDGGRAALAMARVAVEVLKEVPLAIAALERAMKANGDIDEYATMTQHVAILASAPEAAEGFLVKVRAAADQPYSSLGAPVLRLASALAKALGKRDVEAALLVEAARRAPDDEALVHNAMEAAEELGSDSMRASVDDSLPVARGVEALLHLADKHEREGDKPQAAAALERAIATDELTADERDWAVRHLGELLVASDRGKESEELLRRELSRVELSSEARLRLSRELSKKLTARDDHTGALEALADAALRASADPELLAEVRRLARRTGDRKRQVDVLTRLADLAADGPPKLLVLRELAPLVHEVGDRAALAHYEAILEIDPTDEDAINALEADAIERSDHEAVASLLAKRIQIAPSNETRRVLRLRRAAVLEQRLGRLDEACAELEALLVEIDDDVSALRFLGDLYERLAQPLRAAPLWLRVSEIANAIDDKAEHGLRACRCFLAGGDITAARDVLQTVAPMAPRSAVIELRVELARRSGDGRALSDALDQLAATAHESNEKRAQILLEAARAASAIGEEAVALDRARRAAKLAPDFPDAVLEAQRLAYLAGGSGTPREAQAAIDELGHIEAHLAQSQMELYAFLLAEELDVIQGGGAGMRELTRRHAEVGPAPLIALGMAERLVRSKSFDDALPLFERALAGPLQGMRTRGRVALAAAEAAMQANQLEMAARLLEDAAAETETRRVALRRQLELTAQRGGPASARKALEDLAALSSGPDRARVLGQLGEMLAPNDSAGAMRVYAEAIKLATNDRTLHSQLAEQLSRLQGPSKKHASDAPPPSTRRVGALPPPDDEPPPTARRPMPVVISNAFASSASTSLTQLQDAPPAGVRPKADGADEAALVERLMAGSFEAGEELLWLYEDEEARVHDILAIRKQQARLRPGDAGALENLYQAALADGNHPLSRAVLQLQRSFDEDADLVAPPPLSRQRVSDDLVHALLFRDLATPTSEALGLIWEAGLYRREMAEYRLTGLERVRAGQATALGEVYRDVANSLGRSRTPIFHRRAQGALSAEVALLAPPAVVLTGEVHEETPELRFLLGAALAGAMPQHALINGLPEAEIRSLLGALAAAFGPVGERPEASPETSKLVATIWEAVTPRTDRRLREIFESGASLTYEEAQSATKQAMWRAGLFASGDIATTLRMVLVQLSEPLDVALSEPDGLAKACEAQPVVADLVRLATRMEYAEARWQAAEGVERQGPHSWRPEPLE